MDEQLPILPVITPHITVIDLVALARPGADKAVLRAYIADEGVELNAHMLKTPDYMLTVKTGDILRLSALDWHEIKVVDLHEIETERLRLREMELKDIALLEEHLPEWDIVKYLARSLPGGAPPQEVAARDVFRSVIMQPDPRTGWLWKISERDAPEKIVGVAHMQKDAAEAARQNIWIDRAHRKEGLVAEVVDALNEHAFARLGISAIEFKEAFTFAAGAEEIDALRRKFNSGDDGSELHTRDAPDKAWGMTKEKWLMLRARAQKPLQGAPTTPPSVKSTSPPVKATPPVKPAAAAAPQTAKARTAPPVSAAQVRQRLESAMQGAGIPPNLVSSPASAVQAPSAAFPAAAQGESIPSSFVSPQAAAVTGITQPPTAAAPDLANLSSISLPPLPQPGTAPAGTVPATPEVARPFPQKPAGVPPQKSSGVPPQKSPGVPPQKSPGVPPGGSPPPAGKK